MPSRASGLIPSSAGVRRMGRPVQRPQETSQMEWKSKALLQSLATDVIQIWHEFIPRRHNKFQHNDYLNVSENIHKEVDFVIIVA